MGWLITFYLIVAGWVYIVSYEATDENLKEEVRKHWLKYFGQCLAWPFIIVHSGKGFKRNK